jgi:hypothetical protein
MSRSASARSPAETGPPPATAAANASMSVSIVAKHPDTPRGRGERVRTGAVDMPPL